MLDDRERELLEGIERTLLADPRLRKRLESRRPRMRRMRRALATWSLVALVGLLAAATVGLLLLALPGHSLVVALLALWPLAVLRRRTAWRRLTRSEGSSPS